MGPCEFSWERLICPRLRRGDVGQPFLYSGFTAARLSHDPRLIWIPKTPKPVCFFLFSLVEPLLSGGALSASLACWGDKKKTCSVGSNESSLLIYSKLPSPTCLPPSLFLSFSSSPLVKLAAQGGVDEVLFFFLSVSLKRTLKLDTLTSWQPWTVEEGGFVMAGGLLSAL